MDRMFKRCFDDGKYKQAAGIAFETRRIDVLKEAITRSVSGIVTSGHTFGIKLNTQNGHYHQTPSMSVQESLMQGK